MAAAATVLMLSLASLALSAAGKANPISSAVHVIGDLGLTNNDNGSPSQQQYEKCNSGRGNLSETESGTHQTDSDTLINPHEGGQGPGDSPTDDCDPGNSGAVNSGGD